MKRFGLIFALPRATLLDREYVEESPGVPEIFPLNARDEMDWRGLEAWNEFCESHPRDQYIVAMSIHHGELMPDQFKHLKLKLRRFQSAPPEPMKSFTIRPLDLR